MLLTESPWTAAAATATSTPPRALELRMYGGTEDERLIPVPPGKYSVGSGPRCSLRLEETGVGPLHCLIVHDGDGLRVRRWAEDTLVNGMPFDEARLEAGDILSVGPIDLEVVLPPPDEQAFLAIESARPLDRHSRPVRPEPTAYEIGPSDDEPSPVASPAAEEVFNELRAANTVARGRSRRLVAALRRHRDQYDELVERVSDLEQMVQSAFAEPDVSLIDAPQDRPPRPAVCDELDHAELDVDAGKFAAELFEAQQSLSERESELAEARAAIDALERQLIDGQNSMHAFAEERTLWHEQLSELESRLAEYALRIQELERQLDQVRTPKADHAPTARPITSAAAGPSSQKLEDTAADMAEREPAIASSSAAPSPWDAAPREQSESAEFDRGGRDAEASTIEFPSPPSGQATPAAPTPAAVETPARNDSFQPASFIDRYAHLFESDDPDVESPAAPRQSTVGDTVGNEPPWSLLDSKVADVAPSAPLTGVAGDEESIEQYMSKLMERVRGGSYEDPASPDPAKASATAPTPAASSTTVESAQTHAVHDSQAATAAEDAASSDPPRMTLEELKSKVTAPEFATDMVAMRELANQSARHAIGIHTASKLRRNALTRFMIAVLAGVVGLYCMIDSPRVDSVQFLAACMTLVVSIYWWHLTFQALVQAVRVGAFEYYDVKGEGGDSSHPSLPIDVER